MKTVNYVTQDDVFMGLYVWDKTITTKYTLFWKIATLVGIKTYHIEDGKGNGRRFFAVEDLEKAKLVASLI